MVRERSVRELVMDALARREHSYQELLQKLQRYGFSIDEIELALQRLQGQGLQSDERFVEMFVAARTRNGYGPQRIKQELQQRGVSQALIQAAVSTDQDFWIEQLDHVWGKKYRGEVAKNAAEKARQVRFLMQRGFTSDTVMALLTMKERVNQK